MSPMSHASHPHVRIGQNSSVQTPGNTSKRQHSTVPAWRRCLFGAFPPLTALALSLVLVIPASASSLFSSAVVVRANVRLPVISETELSPCTGQPITFSGHAHVEMNDVLNGDLVTTASALIHLHINGQVIGTDAQGTQWVANFDQEQVETVHVAPNADGTLLDVHEEASDPLTVHFVSQGAAPNFAEHFTLHETVQGTLVPPMDRLRMSRSPGKSCT